MLGRITVVCLAIAITIWFIVLPSRLSTSASQRSITQEWSDNPPVARIQRSRSLSTRSDTPNPEGIGAGIQASQSGQHLEVSATRLPLVIGEIYGLDQQSPRREKLELASSSRKTYYRTHANENGYFEFVDVVAATDYVLRISPRGMYKRYRQDRITLSPANVRLDVTLERLPLATLWGQVVNTAALPVPAFSLQIRSTEKSGWMETVTTDRIGGFSLKNVPIGGVVFSSMRKQVMTSRGYSLEADSSSTATVIVDEGDHEIAGMALDSLGEPVPGANVLLDWEGSSKESRSSSYRRTTTNLNGMFSLRGVGSGKHEMFVSDSSGGAYRDSLDVLNHYTNLTIVLEPKL